MNRNFCFFLQNNKKERRETIVISLLKVDEKWDDRDLFKYNTFWHAAAADSDVHTQHKNMAAIDVTHKKPGEGKFA